MRRASDPGAGQTRVLRVRAPPVHVTVAQPVERSPETRGVAGSTPAGHITTARRFESCCLRLPRSGVVELERHAVVTRENAGSIPAAGALHALVVEAVMTPGSQPGDCGFESRRGC